MRVLVEQNEKHSVEFGIAQVFVVLALVLPSLFAFFASLTFGDLWATVPGVGSFSQICLKLGYGAIPVAVGLTALAIYDPKTSTRSAAAMAAVSVAGIILTWMRVGSNGSLAP
jgi:hypothetical protein